MKLLARFILILTATALLGASQFVWAQSQAAAGWVRLVETDEVFFYYDPATIRVNGHLRRVWEIQDLKQRNPAGEMSRRFLSEYDCREERHRLLSFSTHSEPMAGGRILLIHGSPSEWNHIPPYSPALRMFKIVCK